MFVIVFPNQWSNLFTLVSNHCSYLLKSMFIFVKIKFHICSNNNNSNKGAYLFKSLLIYLVIYPGGWRGEQQCSHTRNPGETSPREERSPQQDEGGGRE